MMLELKHANLPVPDVAPLRDFFVRHFGFTEQETRGNDAFVVLRGDDGFVLNLMRSREGEVFPKNFHVGFVLDDADAVRAKHQDLRDAGVEVGEIESLGRRGPASVTFYCWAPNRLLIEVGSRDSGVPAAELRTN
jgi:catechol 2,3-dioxygenase-like lactoylglutathione lyase family enzyme